MLLAQKKSLQVCPYSILPFIVIGVLVLLYLPTFSGLWHRWLRWDEALAHGLPVIAVFCYLLYQSVPWAAQSPSRVATGFACALIALISLFWMVFHVIQITILEQLILLPLLALALLPLFGLRTLAEHRYLLLLPIFILPLWDYLNEPLLRLSSIVVGELVRMIRMPALIEGSSIYIPYGVIMIADGCSGIRYFVISLTLGYLISYLNGYREKGLLVVLSIAALLGLFANWVRIFLLILIGYQTEMQTPLMEDHEMFGWIVFGVLMLPAIYFAPVVRRNPSDLPVAENQPPFPVGVLVATIAALSVGPLLALGVDLKPRDTGGTTVHHRQAELTAVDSLPVRVTAPTKGDQQAYRLLVPGVPIFVQVNQYRRIEQSDKLVPYISRLYDAELWMSVESRRVSIDEQTAELRIFRQKAGPRQIAQLQWFNTGGYSSTSVAAAKLLQIPAMFFGDNHFLIVSLQAECQPGDCHQAVEQLDTAVRQLTLAQD